ncbi:MAG: GPW/gp25 family protein [Alphaproteobacteria bacterium]|nr:GPW/gp25 family protein [Alphaproteobacteria bacterium]MCB9931166.1 GPW/gp25 family protein [Alphaproteobacteria bacterium]
MMVSAEEDIRQSLTILLRTRPGERVMQPDYGCGIYRYVFDIMDANLEANLQDEIRQAILFFEPRIRLDAVTVTVRDSLGGRLDITIVYTVRATNNRSNIVFPFYLNEGTLVPADAAPT